MEESTATPLALDHCDGCHGSQGCVRISVLLLLLLLLSKIDENGFS